MPSLLDTLYILLSLALPLVLMVVLIDKMGYNRWFGLLIIVPLANLGLLIYLVSAPWPVQRELAVRRLKDREGKPEDGRIAYREATRLQKNGRHQDADRIFSLIEAGLPGSEIARDAAISKSELAGKNV